MRKIYEKTVTGEKETVKKEAMRKKRILFLVDNHQWCWTTSCQNMAKNLPDFECKIVSAAEWKQDYKELMNNCDLIYMRGYPFIFLAGLPPINKPYIWTLSTGGDALAARIEQSFPFAAAASACIVQNQQAFDMAAAAGIKNVHLIPNGIDTEHFKPLNIEQSVIVGFAGNNSGSREDLKGTEFVKDACNMLKIPYSQVTLENKLTHEQMPDFYNSIQIYTQPSASEGCSNSVMEAMSCRKVCLICENVGYHGENCKGNPLYRNCNVLFVLRDAKDIAEKIYFLIKNPDKYAEISANARQFAEKHEWKLMIKHHRNLILKSLSEWIEPVIEGKYCKNCQYCNILRCQRFPPVIAGSRSEFPKVNADLFCGEWCKK